MKKVKLSTFVVLIFLAALSLVAGTVTYLEYIRAETAIEQEVSRQNDLISTVSKLSFESDLEYAKHILTTINQNDRVMEALEARSDALLREALQQIYFANELANLDIFFVTPHLSKSPIVGGESLYDSSQIIAQAIAYSSLDFTKKLFADDAGGLVMLTRREIVSEETGRVLGYVYGGSILNDNVNPLASISQATSAKAVQLIYGGELLASYSDMGAFDYQLIQENASVRIVDVLLNPNHGVGEPDLSARVYVDNAKTSLLSKHFLDTLVAVAVAIVIVALVSALILHHIAETGISALTQFASQVSASKKKPEYHPSIVEDFNAVGWAFQEVVDQLTFSEERFRDFAEIGADWFWEMGPDMRYTYFSGRIEDVMDVKLEDLIGKSRPEIYFNQNGVPPKQWKEHAAIFERREPFSDFRCPWVRKDGDIRYITMNGQPVYSNDGEFLGYRGIGRDISKRVIAETKMLTALDKAEQASRAKSEFLATMSHEFRTPLNAIIGFSEALKHEYFGDLGSDQNREYVGDIHWSGQHLLGLVNDILDISSIEAGKRIYDKILLNVPDVMREIERSFSHMTKDYGINLVLDMEDDIPEIHADHRSLRQIMTNLVSNAFKYTQEAGEVKISLRNYTDKIEISVSDTGKGISEKDLKHVIEPFIQGDGNPYRAEEGTGLGLSIVTSLIRVHDGEFDIQSKLGEGTVVTFSLPRLLGSYS